MGSEKWLNLHRYNSAENNTIHAIEKLKKQNYRIVATTPHSNAIELDEFDFGKSKFALFFGTELNGLSEIAIDNADEFVKIPMVGFTESFNISVSAAIILHQLSAGLWKSEVDWKLSDKEIIDLKLEWLRKTIKDSKGIENDFYSKSVNSQKLMN